MRFLQRTVIVIYDDRIDAISVNHRARVVKFMRRVGATFADPVAWKTKISQFVGEIQSTFGRTQTTVVLALTSTQVRAIDGLPQSSDAKAIRQIIASSPSRYAPRRFSNPIVSAVIVRKPGEVMVAFADLDVVLGIASICFDGSVDLREICVAPDLTSIRVLDSNQPTVDDMERVLSGTLVLPRPEWRSAVVAPTPAWRPHTFTIAATLLLLSAAVLAPAWRLVVARHDFRRTISRTIEVDSALRRAMQLDSLRGPLDRARATAARSIHPLLVLDQIGDALGTDGHMLAFEADSTIVQTTVAAPSLVPFLRRLERN